MSQPNSQFFAIDEPTRLGAVIKVVGVGGGGSNAVDRMIESNLSGVDFIAVNTDAQALTASRAPTRLQVGVNLTKGLGAGADPRIGRDAANEDMDRILELLDGADMVFVTAGMGGGTGTGAAPVIAKVAKELGALTVAVVTKPFVFEGKHRSRQAEEGLQALREFADTVITIPNERLISTVDSTTTLTAAFRMADDVLRLAVQGISDLITVPGIINLDFADVRTIMAEKGQALMGTGIAKGENRAVRAAEMAMNSPLLEESSIQGAKGLLINMTGARNDALTLFEVTEAASMITEAAADDAQVIFGTAVDESLDEENIKITVIATGFTSAEAAGRTSRTQRRAAPQERRRQDPPRTVRRSPQGPSRPPVTAAHHTTVDLDKPTFERKASHLVTRTADDLPEPQPAAPPAAIAAPSDRLAPPMAVSPSPADPAPPQRSRPIFGGIDTGTVDYANLDIPAFLRRRAHN